MKLDQKKYPVLSQVLKASEEVDSSEPSLKPPSRWWNKMEKEVKEGNPSYSEEKVRETIGSIWYNLSKAKRAEIREREGKHYGAAP